MSARLAAVRGLGATAGPRPAGGAGRVGRAGGVGGARGVGGAGVVGRAGGAGGVGGAVLGVAAALRAGASPSVAWDRCWGIAAPDGIPALADVAARCGDPRHAAAVVAGARLAARTGASLAVVLERVGAALADDEAVEVQRRAALAGPRSTVRVLSWLPLAGVGLGWSLGADPVAVLLDGGGGTALLAGAALLTWAGRAWSGRLVAAARGAGVDP
ncbi:type II secretion system F family protein [Actinotalea fermentans]|uniref:type II secretion system F family protein n=1 Tax=Actinotalea fermentans TaxID=43671 RepID=UPI001C99CEE8|nr:hypothetical protein [Actinotalea fermentans]